jgi:DnaJ-class molecular chaperone
MSSSEPSVADTAVRNTVNMDDYKQFGRAVSYYQELECSESPRTIPEELQCPACEGAGAVVVRQISPHCYRRKPCPTCKGSGRR